MTIKVLLLLLALLVVCFRAQAYEAPCFVLGEKHEYRNFGDFGKAIKRTENCEISKVTPSVYECQPATKGSLVYQWTWTREIGTPFYILNIYGEEVGYYFYQDQAEDAFMESECSSEK